ncbi:MAG: ferritin-like domain-containing protein [Clostridia bacterium]|nr:ferritin-like domain-containing protein [Clostridia bacterium]
MIVRNENQALCVAVEMERRAIRVYERALMLADDPRVQQGIREILKDENDHLCRFRAMQTGHTVDPQEERMLISSMAAEVLFTGGVMEMHREKALTTLLGLYRYAADSEADAVKIYAEFARKCDDADVRETFMSIVREESKHLGELRAKVAELEKES